MLLYALTILVSAFLLFQVQPIIAKIILPWFGGSAAVWTVCLLFFQLALLAGYSYAHALVRYCKPRAQMLIHTGLLVVSVLALPIYPGAQWKPAPLADPTWGIVSLLAAKIGIPYFLLSTTGPLLQAWYARSFKGAMPYRLYALSNAGSMFALLSYPFLFEPVFTTHQQATMWSIAYGAFIADLRGHRASFAAKPRCFEIAPPETPRRSQRRQAHGGALLVLAGAARRRLRAAAGHHQSPFAECGGHSVSMGSAAEHLPADLHPVFRWRLVLAQSLPATAGGGVGRHGLQHWRGYDRQYPDLMCWCRCSPWACLSAAWCAMASWRA